MSSKMTTVVGFQYEPKRVGCAVNTVNDNLYDDDVEEQQLSNTVNCGRLDLLYSAKHEWIPSNTWVRVW